jgi:hypothetical protein
MTITTSEILDRIGEDPARLCTLPEVVETLRKAGFPISKGTIYKAQMAGNAPPRFIWTNRSVYRLGDVVEWAHKRVRKAKEARAARSAQTQRANAVELRDAAQEPVAAAA